MYEIPGISPQKSKNIGLDNVFTISIYGASLNSFEPCRNYKTTEG